MKTKKLLMLLLTTSIMFGATRVNVFADKQVNLSSEATTEALEETTTETIEDSATDTIEESAIKIIEDVTTEPTMDETTEVATQTTKASKASTKTREIASAKTVSTKQASAKKASYTKTDLRILTAIIYCEAGYESYNGKIAVANVILNRVNSKVFDHVDTVKEVVYDLKRWGRQFSPAYVRTSSGNYTTNGSLLEKALKLYTSKNYTSSHQRAMMEESEKAAIAALEGKNVIGDYLYFNSLVSSTKAMCKKNNKPYTIIGAQIFY